MNDSLKAFNQLVAAQQTPRAVADFADIFFTEAERAKFAERLAIFRALATGHSQRAITRELGCSVVTVSRGAKAYRENKAAIDRLLKQLPETQHAV